MKKTIAKLSNAVRDRRRENKEYKIEIGKVYLVKHSVHVDRKIKITMFNDTWAEGELVTDPASKDPEEVILMRELCTFTELKG